MQYGSYSTAKTQEQFYPYNNGNAAGFSISLLKTRYEGTYTKEKLIEILGNDIVFLYAKDEPFEYDLTEEEINEYINMDAAKELQTHKPYTYIGVYTNDYLCVQADYVADPKTYIDNKYNELKNAILSLGGNV